MKKKNKDPTSKKVGLSIPLNTYDTDVRVVGPSSHTHTQILKTNKKSPSTQVRRYVYVFVRVYQTCACDTLHEFVVRYAKHGKPITAASAWKRSSLQGQQQ